MATKLLVVTADGLGASPAVNAAIAAAHRSGILTSATLLPGGEAAAAAAELAREHPQLGVGLLIALTRGAPLLPPAQVPSLAGPDGRLPPDAAALGRAAAPDVLAETRAQLALFRRLAGREPTHLALADGAHVVTAALEALVTLGWETGIALRSDSAETRDRFRREGLSTSDRLVELPLAGATLEGLVELLGGVELGATELLCSPWQADHLQLLTHREPRAAIQAGGIRLVHYGALGA
jgi:predicted glycoside hydrolase/deacetylase ChbG (UPF0249 family)